MAINCSDIQTIANSLKDKFQPCYRLTAVDLDTMVDLTLAVEACVVAGQINWGSINGALVDQTDLQGELDAKEIDLGNPATDGFVLSSTTLGVRSWIAGVSGSTNLTYTPSPTDGTVTSDTGTDATLTLANGTNAGLMNPAYFTALSATSGTNTGDNAVNSLYSGLVSNATHTGDVTGDTILTIGVGAVDLAMLSASGTPGATNFLRGDNTWATPAGSGNVSTSGVPVLNDFARFVGATDIEGRSYAETRTDLGLVIGTNVQAYSLDLDNVSNTNSGDNAVNSLYSGLVSNVTTDLSVGTITGTTLDVNSSDGTNATLPEASTTDAGLLSSGNWDNITANTAKVSNVTHTGDVTGDAFLTIAVDAVDIPMLSASGTADGTTFLRGDNTWSLPAPVSDATAIVMGSVDNTKLVRIEADGLTTSTTRVITMPDSDVDLGDLGFLSTVQTWAAENTFASIVTGGTSGFNFTVKDFVVGSDFTISDVNTPDRWILSGGTIPLATSGSISDAQITAGGDTAIPNTRWVGANYTNIFLKSVTASGNYTTLGKNLDTSKAVIQSGAAAVHTLDRTGLTIGFQQQVVNNSGGTISFTSGDTVIGDIASLLPDGEMAYYALVSATEWVIVIGGLAGAGAIGGSITDNQVAVGATAADDIEGTSGLTYDGTALGITGNITLTGTVDGVDIATDVAANTSKVTNVTTDLSYTAAPTNGTVTSSDGTNATLTLATGTNAGLLAPADFTTLGTLEDPTINAQTGTTYTLLDADKNKSVTLTNAAAITLTVSSTLALPIGAEIHLAQLGAGQVTVTASGATVNKHASDTLKLDGQGSWATLKQTATDVWSLFGRLEAV